ncbi:MAG: PLP-dependent aspartate aminotransferase family protein [Planctomycetota bacterium]|nr:PLP-dependent aspartate aminotransferase family protein [Planctomycetota bacterium]
MDEPLQDESLCARGGWFEDFTTRPSNPPLYQTTAFDLHGVEQLDAVVSGVERGYIYTRDGNPNHTAFAADIAKLEHADAGAVCASGMAAISAILLSHLKSGDHVVAARVLYGRTSQQLEELTKRFGIEVTFADSRSCLAMRDARRENTKLCLVESISNPLLEVVDLQALVNAMGEVPVVVDNTFATPCLFRPMEHGAKLVFHSASKYLNGHGDVMLGVVAGERAAVTRVRRIASLFGLNANPFECWLASRGLRTLPLRVERASSNALQIAGFLERHLAVSRVIYPGLASHPDFDLASHVLPHGCGGMLSFELQTAEAGVRLLLRELADTIPFSPTLADVRTTVSWPAGTSHKFMAPDDRRAWGISDGLLRLSVGIDSVQDVISELDRALNQTLTAK